MSIKELAINKKRLEKFSNIKIPDDIENYEKYLFKYDNKFILRIENIKIYFKSKVLSINENKIIEFLQTLLDYKGINKIIKKREYIARRPGCGKPLTQEADNDSKLCSKCNINKNILEFPKIGRICKQCKNLYKKNYKQKHSKDELYNENIKQKKKQYQKQYYEKNKEKIKLNVKIYHQENIDAIKKRTKQYRQNNPHIIYNQNKKYKEKYPERVKEYKNKSAKRPISIIIRSAHRKFKKLFKSDNFKFYEYFRIQKDIYIKWIENNFNNNMNWQNYGTYWHLDHIKPCSSFDLSKESEFLECFHWNNLRPCEKTENLRKSNKIDTNLIEHYKNKAKEFEKINASESDN